MTDFERGAEARTLLKRAFRIAQRHKREWTAIWLANGGEEGTPPYLMHVPADDLRVQALRYSGAGGADAAEAIAREILGMLRASPAPVQPPGSESREARWVQAYDLFRAAQDDSCNWPGTWRECGSGADCNCRPIRELAKEARRALAPDARPSPSSEKQRGDKT